MKSIVKQTKKFLNNKSLFLGLFFLIIIILIVINPAKYAQVSLNGVLVWAKILLPSLLPFFILTKLFSATGVINDITKYFSKPTKKLYNCPSESAYVFLMSVLTGYPVGSKLVSDLHKEGKLTTAQAIRTTSFSSNSGPMFILGSVAIGMFADKKMGFVMLFAHILGALINGLVYRNYKIKKEKLTDKSIQNSPANYKIDFSESVLSSVNSILLIGGVICFTFVLLEALTTNPLFTYFLKLISKCGLDSNFINAFICGIGEITKGCLMLSSLPLTKIAAYTICTFIITFGGISTFLQARAFLKEVVPAKIFLLQKFTHALISSFICFLLCLII